MRRLPRSSGPARRPLSAALARWLAAVLAASALAGVAAPAAAASALPAGVVLAQGQTVTVDPADEDKDNDGFRDEDPSQPWPLYVLGFALVAAAIFATVKLFRSWPR